MWLAMLHGFLLAFSLILPLGAQNIFIFIQGAQAERFIRTLPAVITAALSDTLLIGLAVEGISLILFEYPFVRHFLLIAGVVFLIRIGWSIWGNAATIRSADLQPFSSWKQISYALSVSLLNPHAIMDTVGVIGTNALSYTGNEKWGFALACVSVSWLWFFSLAFIGKSLGQASVINRLLPLINKLSALTIWLVASYLLVKLIAELA